MFRFETDSFASGEVFNDVDQAKAAAINYTEIFGTTSYIVVDRTNRRLLKIHPKEGVSNINEPSLNLLTDRHRVLDIAYRLGLNEDHEDRTKRISFVGDSIIFNEGDGYSCFSVQFNFDSKGKLTSHGVWE